MKSFKQKLITLLAVFMTMGSPLAAPAIALADELEDNARTELIVNDDYLADEKPLDDQSTGKVSTATESSDTPNSNSSQKNDIGESANSNDSPLYEKNSLESDITDDEVGFLTTDETGTVYYNGEPLYVNSSDNVPANLEELMKTGVPTSLKTRAVGSAAIEFLGYVRWGLHSVGNFRINGKQGFCIEHKKSSPPTGTPNTGLEVYNNVKIQAVLYWGWDGPNNIFSDSSAGIVATSLALSHYYYGDSYNSLPPGYDTLIAKAEAGDVPKHGMNLNGSNSLVNLSVAIRDGKQVSSSATLTADSANYIEFRVPNDLTFVNETTGATATNVNVRVYGGQSFHFEADLKTTKTMSGNDLSGIIQAFQPLLVKPVNGNYQVTATWRWYDDPAQKVSFKADFFAREGYGKIKKIDENGNPIEGAEFTIIGSDGSSVTKTTDVNGEINVTYIDGIELNISETKAAHGYVRDTKTEIVKIVAGETQTVTFTNALQTAQFKLLKEDSETGNTPQGQATLEGAIYGLYDATGQELERVTISKDADGNYSSTTKDTYAIETGYYFQEITAPTGYLKSDEKIAVTAAYAGQDVAVSKVTATAKEAVKKGGFDGIKVSNYDWRTTAWNAITQANDGDNIQQPLAGVEFTVYQNFGANSEVAKTTTDAQGFFEVTDLPYGTYRVSETKTPVGYQPIDDFYVTISEHGQTFHYSIVDKVVEAKIQFVKVDAETGKRVVRSNAGFEIYSETTGEQLIQKDLNNNDVSVFYTDDKGELNFPTMFAFGSYKAVEVKAPNGYVVADQPFYFDVTGTETNGVVVVEMTNMPVKGQFVVNKTVETGTGVVEKESEFGNYFDIQYTQQAGAGFQFKARALEDITTADGTVRTAKGAFVQYNGADVVVTTDANGKATSPVALYPGKYEAVEVTAPAGVVKSDPTPFEIKYEGQSVNVTSTSVSVENSLNSIDITGYKQQEVVAGWEDGQAVIELENAKNGQVFSLNIGQDVQLGNTTLASGSSLGYATVKDGKISFANLTLPNQKLDLYLSEVYAGEDYVLSEDEYHFTYTPATNDEKHEIHVWSDSFAENKAANTKIARNPIVNELARVTVKLVKVDGLDNLPLEDVAFNLVRIDGEGDDAVETVVGKFATNAAGEIVVQDLPTGAYRFDETRPLDWYEDNAQDLSFTVTPAEDGTVIELNAVNERKPLEIVTDFATTKDGHKQINPNIDNELTDYGTIEGMKEGHTYYVDTFYMNQDKEVVDQTSFEITGDGTELQEFETDLTVPKGTLGDGQILAAKHIIYSDPEKENEVGRHNEELDDPKQMVAVKTPKVTIKTKATTENGTNTFTHGDVINMSDDVEITHDDVLDGTERAFQTILVAALPDGTEQDIWESDVIDYVVSDAIFAQTVVTEKIDTGKYPVGTRFYFKEEGFNEVGDKDIEHNFDGKDKEQDLYGLTPKLPQTGETIGAISFATVVIIAIVGATFYFMGRKKEEQQ